MASNGKGSAKGKGKAVASKGSSGKRKREDDKTRSGRKKTNPAVLQFFEDSAAEASDYDTSDFEEDFPDDDEEEEEGLTKTGEPHKSQKPPVKEEELSGDELERVLEERYKTGSGYVRYAEDDYEMKRVDKNFGVPSAPEPVIWKVKCKVGRERQPIFCLMQKFADLKALGTKLQIVSAFSVEHVRGFIFVEANKQFEVMEACKQLPDVYYSMITPVPSSEFSQMLAVRKKKTEVSKGMWVRVKSGNYKGDLAQVVAVGDSRKKATLKLIPRVDFQALAAKFGAGSSIKRAAVPKPRLISSSDLEEFRPLIQSRRDRDTGMIFEVLDGLMLKDGYLYKKVSVDSLRTCDVNPSIEELQKFRVSNNEDSSNVEFLSQLYGDKKETPAINPVQVGGKGEGTSGSKEQEDIEVHDLVLFGKREFGMVIGMEKDESYKILKYGLEGSVVVSLSKKDLKNLNPEKKFNALDRRMKTVFVNDVVKVLDGPLKDKEGVVKQIYRGIIFLYDQNDMEDNAYFCAKSQSCEKVKHDICLGKDGEVGPSGCEDLPSSPKTPLSPEKPWQTEEQSRSFNRREQQDGEFSVGQSLRIRVGPLKGYLCRVLAVRRSDVTVKLDSRQKVLTVKSEHLSEVRGKSFATSTCDDTGLDSSKPFDFLGNNAGGNDWMAGSAQNNEKNEEGQSTEGSSWPAFTSSAPSQPWGASSGDTSAPTEDDPWQKKPNPTLDGGSGWGNEVKVDIPSVPQNDTSSSWDKGKNVTEGTSTWGNVAGGSSWGKEVKTDIPSIPQQDTSSSWDKGKNVTEGTSTWGNLAGGSSWGKEVKTDIPSIPQQDTSSSWDKGKTVIGGTSNWGNLASEKDNEPSGSVGWGQPKPTVTDSQNSWGQPKNSQDKGTNPTEDSWGKTAGQTWGSKADPIGTKDWTIPAPAGDSENGGWGAGGASNQADDSKWGKPKSSSEGPSWGKSDLKQQDGSTQKEGWNVGGASGERSSEPAVGWNSASSGWGQQKPSDASGVKSGGWGDSSGKWGTQTEDNAPSRNSSGNDSWGNNQGRGGGRGDYGGRGGDFGGRRGRGGFRGGRDQPGRGRGGRQSWNNEGEDKPSWGGSSGGGWGKNNQGGGGGGSGSWGNEGGSAGGGWGTSGGASNQGGSGGGGWAKESEGGGSAGGASNQGGGGGGGGWAKESGGGGSAGGGWGTSGGASNQGGGGGGGWAKESGSGSWGNEGGNAGGGWGTSGGASNQGGGGGGGGWAKESGGGSGGWGNNDKGESGGGKWGAQKEDNAPSWNSSGNDSWGNNRGRGGGRGDYGCRGGDFGGRRGRGGFRGGRDQPGRGRGGRSFGGRQSWNNEGEEKPSWGGSSGGGWGNNNQGGGGGGSWGNDKGGSDGGSTWGASSGVTNDGGSGWGSSSGGKASTGGWGGSSGTKGEEGGGSGWGNTKAVDAGSSGGWGKPPSGQSGAGGEEKATGAGGWGSSSAGKGDEGGSSGWGNTKAVDAGSSGGWGKLPSGPSGAGGTGGWGGSSAGAKGDEGAGSAWGSTKAVDTGSSGGASGWGSSAAKPATSGWGGSEGAAGSGGSGWGGANKDQGSGGGGGW